MHLVINSLLALGRWWYGLKREELAVDGITWSYLDSYLDNDAPIVVVLHGFSSIKESMMRVVAPLLSKYRVVMPDLPGHGLTNADLHSYRAAEQADRLSQFLRELFGPTKKFHIMGCSMGGMISGVLAARHSDLIVSVTLICPAGITMPNKSPIYQVYEETGENHMRVKTIEDFDRLRTYMSHKQSRIPRFIGHFVVSEAERRREVIEELMRDILLDSTVLDDCLERFSKPCLVVWGDSDKILDISCLEIIKKKVKSPLTVKIVPNAGHIVHQEQHAEVAVHVVEFLSQLHQTNIQHVHDLTTRA